MAKALGLRFTRSRFFAGFVCGAAVGAVASGLAARNLLREPGLPPQPSHSPIADALTKQPQEEEGNDLVPVPVLEKYGFPVAGSQTRYYTNHALSYDQTKRVPRWVIEHISKHKTLGTADRKHCKFRPDPSIPPIFSAMNEDYIGSGWSRGHMAPAGDNKYSPKAMAETFYLSNIVPQNYENNAGFWNRVEMYCRELTERFEDVWIVSGPLTLPQMKDDGKKRVTYEVLHLEFKFSAFYETSFTARSLLDNFHFESPKLTGKTQFFVLCIAEAASQRQVIGKDDVAVPSHLYKVILGRQSEASTEPLVLGAFVVPNIPIGFDHQLQEFQVNIEDLERISGLVFFPKVNKSKDVRDICEIDTCKLMGLEEFILYISARKIQNAKTLERLEKVVSELQEKGIKPDEYLLKVYEKKKEELATQEPVETREGRAG